MSAPSPLPPKSRRRRRPVHSEGGDEEEEEEKEEEADVEERSYLREQWNAAFEDDIEDLLGEEPAPPSDEEAAQVVTDLVQVEDDGYAPPPQSETMDVSSLITVLNIVVTATLTSSEPGEPRVPVSIDLLEVVLRGARLGFQMNKRRFSAAILSCIRPSCCVLIFELGVIVCAGCKNLDEAKGAIEQVVGYLRDIRPSYAKLRAVDMRIRNMVGRVCVPCNIDVEKLQKENPTIVIKGMIDTCVKLAPPPPIATEEPEAEEATAANSKSRRKKERRAGSTLVCWSGYLLIIGGKSSAEMVRSFNYAYNIVKPYFTGSVETTFSVDKIRRYYTGLKTAYEMCEGAPKSFIAVRNDGTEAPADEWRAMAAVSESVVYYKQLTDNPTAAIQRRIAVTEYLTPQMIEEEKKQTALVLASKGGALVAASGATTGALINRTGGNALEIIKASNDARKHVARVQMAKQRVASVTQQMALRDYVAAEGSEIRAVKKMKQATKMATMSMDQASQLDQGISAARKWAGLEN